jgi:hypothetical protein
VVPVYQLRAKLLALLEIVPRAKLLRNSSRPR